MHAGARVVHRHVACTGSGQAREQGLKFGAVVGHGAGYGVYEKLKEGLGGDVEYFFNTDPISIWLTNEKALDDKLSERIQALDERVNERIQTLDDKFAERFLTLDEKFSERLHDLDEKFSDRIQALDDKFAERFLTLDEKFSERIQALDDKFTERFEGTVHRIEALVFKSINKHMTFSVMAMAAVSGMFTWLAR